MESSKKIFKHSWKKFSELESLHGREIAAAWVEWKRLAQDLIQWQDTELIREMSIVAVSADQEGQVALRVRKATDAK